MIIYIQL